MIRRLVSAVLIAWVMGFAFFVGFLPRPAGAETTDGIIVLTGGPNRIERGVSLLEQRKAKRMLVSGVDLTVQRRDFLYQFKVPPRVFDCCIDLGQEAVDTRSNGAESAAWVKKRGYKSIRLITTDWHMRRARLELDQALPPGISIRMDAVRSDPDLGILLTEYHKFALRRFAVLFGI